MNILITGSGGYLGGRITAHFEKHHSSSDLIVYSASRSTRGVASAARFRHFDLTDFNTIHGVCENIDVIVHCAALNEALCASNPELAYSVNVEGMSRLLEEAHDAGVSRVVYLSTVHVYGAPLTDTLMETTPPIPVGAYAITHKAAEDLVISEFQNGRIEGYCIRLSNVVGAPIVVDVPRRTLVANDLCLQAIKHRKISLLSDGRQYRDFLCMSDMLVAITHAALSKNLECGIYNVASGNSIKIIELADLIAERASLMLGVKITVNRPLDDYRLHETFDVCVEKVKSAGVNLSGNLSQEIDDMLHMFLSLA